MAAVSCVCDCDVLFEEFFRYKESIDPGLPSHKKLELTGVSVTREEDISNYAVEHRVRHVGDVVLLQVEGKLKMSRVEFMVICEKSGLSKEFG